MTQAWRSQLLVLANVLLKDGINLAVGRHKIGNTVTLKTVL